MLQRGAHALLFLVCSPFLARCEDYTVKFEVALTPERRDSFLVTVREAKSPIAARRFKELVNSNFFTGSPFYRVMPGFLVQFGLSGNVTLQREWDRKVLQEERAIEHKDWNMRGTIAFATSGAGGGTQGRSTQLFINYDDNHQLDNAGVVPFGRIVRGMHVVDAIYSGYRDRPQAADIRQQGDAYLQREFPRISRVYGAMQVAFVEEPMMISKNVMGALITVGMAMAAALCCFSLRVLQRRSKGYNKAPLAGRSFDDPEDDDADEDDDGHDASMGSSLTRRS